jgi:YgiT-type zinc finger domain-containing protein
MTGKKKYKITCRSCGNPNMWEIITTTVHPIGELNIYLVDVPCFHCSECGGIAYRGILGVADILSNAYANDLNVVVFDERDYEGLFNQELF